MTVDLRLAIPAGIAWIAVWILLGIPAVLQAAAVVSWALAVACVVVAILARRSGSRAGGGWRGWAAIVVVIATVTFDYAMAPWSSSVNGSTVSTSGDLVVDARSSARARSLSTERPRWIRQSRQVRSPRRRQ
jgi:hypothetical protein